jgi:RNA polymerase sigma factor (sigma-70 family)
MLVDPSARALNRLGRLVGDGTELVSDADLLRRYVHTRDGTAFAALVRRHGPMVFGVCRRTLGHMHDAEDAFQATFLVLARKARGVRPDEVSRWLYGVAVRVANKARIRRKPAPVELSEIAAPAVAPAPDWLPLLDAALTRLPDRYRRPILLCDLQGRTRAEAAAELGIAEGTLSSRLARARAKLRSKLIQRGVVPTIAFAAAMQAEPVPAALVESTLSVGASTAARQLAEGVVRSMFFAKLTTLVASTACVLGAVTLGIIAVPGAGADPAAQSKSDPKAKEPPPKAKDDVKPTTTALPDMERIRGTWEIVEVPRWVGDKPDVKKLFGQTITFESDRVTTSLFPGQNKSYRLDPGWDPKRLDFILRDGLGGEPSLIEGVLDVPKEINVPAIYRFDGDKLRLGIGSSSKNVRPESFDLRARDALFTELILRRKADAPRETAAREPTALEGTWESVAVDAAGMRHTPPGSSLVFEGNRLLIHSTATDSPRDFEYTVDRKPSPPHIDLKATADDDSLKKGQVLKGLYTLDGDLLTLTVGSPSAERPKTLFGSNHPTMYYKRKGTNPKLPPGGVTPRLRELQQERVKALKEIADAYDQGLMLGKGNVLDAVRADEDVAAVELELATSDDEKAKVLEHLIERLKSHELKALYNTTTHPNTDHSRVKASRLRAEIELERLKAGK